MFISLRRLVFTRLSHKSRRNTQFCAKIRRTNRSTRRAWPSYSPFGEGRCTQSTRAQHRPQHARFWCTYWPLGYNDGSTQHTHTQNNQTYSKFLTYSNPFVDRTDDRLTLLIKTLHFYTGVPDSKVLWGGVRSHRWEREPQLVKVPISERPTICRPL